LEGYGAAYELGEARQSASAEKAWNSDLIRAQIGSLSIINICLMVCSDREESTSMNILMFCYEYPPIGGGGGVGAQQYAQAFVRKGHRVTMITSRAKGLPAREDVRGVEVIRVMAPGRKDRATATFVSMLAYNVFGLIYLIARLRTLKKYNVINTHFSIPTGPLSHFASWLLGIPNVLTIIGGDIYDPSKRFSPHRWRLFRMINRKLINEADRVVAISTDTKKRAEEYYQIERPIQVIIHGFSPQLIEEVAAPPMSLASGHFHLVALGRLVPRKGFEYLLRAMAQLPEDVEVWIIGDGPLYGPLTQLAKELGVAARAHILGYQSRANIDYYLKHSNVFVLSSLHEGLGIVVQEAMYAGLPVVATDHGGQVDLIYPRRNGLLVPIENSLALAKAIRQLRHQPELAGAMAEHNREDIAKLYIDVNCRQYLELFDELTREPRRDN